MLASKIGNVETVHALLNKQGAHANPLLHDGVGWTASDYSTGNPTII